MQQFDYIYISITKYIFFGKCNNNWIFKFQYKKNKNQIMLLIEMNIFIIYLIGGLWYVRNVNI